MGEHANASYFKELKDNYGCEQLVFKSQMLRPKTESSEHESLIFQLNLKIPSMENTNTAPQQHHNYHAQRKMWMDKYCICGFDGVAQFLEIAIIKGGTRVITTSTPNARRPADTKLALLTYHGCLSNRI